MASRFDRALRAVALAALAVYLLGSAPPFLRNVLVKIHEARFCAGRDLETARGVVLGEKYVRGVEAIRAEIPEDGAYMLVDESGEQGSANWVRFDLAPRLAWFIGRLKGAKRELDMELRPPESPRFVVIARPDGEAPLLVESAVFFGADIFPGQRRDDQIPASIDTPKEDARLEGPVVVTGWCQEPGGRPCAEVRIYIDGRPLPAELFERVPRPDVEAAVSGIGACDRAGYRARYRLAPDEAGRHSIVVFLSTADGRVRRFGPQTFEWKP